MAKKLLSIKFKFRPDPVNPATYSKYNICAFLENQKVPSGTKPYYIFNISPDNKFVYELGSVELEDTDTEFNVTLWLETRGVKKISSVPFKLPIDRETYEGKFPTNDNSIYLGAIEQTTPSGLKTIIIQPGHPK
jgi:hypothetical protein